MSDKQVQELESVILEVHNKLKLRKTDKVPTLDLFKKILSGTLREHMWDILVMNAEFNMSNSKNNLTKHDDILCTWIGTLFINMAKHLRGEKTMILKITEDDPMPWWDKPDKIRQLLLKRDNEKRSTAIGLTSNNSQDSSHLPQSKNITIVPDVPDDSAAISHQEANLALSNSNTGGAVIASLSKKQETNGKRCRDPNDDDYDGYDDYADVCIASMTEIFELAEKQQANDPLHVLSRQALQVEQFRAQTILKTLKTGKQDFSLDDRRSMLSSLIPKSKHEAERLRTVEKLNAYNCGLEASDINL